MPKILVGLILVLISMTAVGTGAASVDQAPTSSPLAIASLDPHAPFTISDNLDFNLGLAVGVRSGAGTSANPWIISDWEINGAGTPGITVSGTTDYFVIRNITAHDSAPGQDGITLYNVQHAEVYNTTLWNNRYGIRVGASTATSWVNVSGNTIMDSSGAGVLVDATGFPASTNNVSVYSNMIYNTPFGIHVQTVSGAPSATRDIRVLGNSVNDTNFGIALHLTDYSNVSGNLIWDVGFGIQLNGANYNEITANDISAANVYGIWVEASLGDSAYNLASWNVIHDSPNGLGIYFGGVPGGFAHNNNASYNWIYFEGTGGIYLSNSPFDELYRNVIEIIGADGIYVVNSDYTSVVNNAVNNTAGNGLYVLNSNFCLARGNLLQNNSGSGLYSVGAGLLTITGNSARNNTHGFYADTAGAQDYSDNLAFYNSNHGIWISAASGNSIGNLVTDNEVYSNGESGIYVGGSGGTVNLTDVTWNYAHDNTVFGIYLANTTSNNVSNNSLYRNHHGIHVESSSLNTVNGNFAEGNEVGIHLVSRSSASAQYNDFQYNELQGNTGAGFRCERTATGQVSQNRIMDNLIHSQPSGIEIKSCSQNGYWRNSIHDMNEGILVTADGGIVSYYENISDNAIYDNFWQGIILDQPTGEDIRFTSIWNNYIGGSWWGLRILGASDLTVGANNIEGNSVSGVSISGSSNNEFKWNKIKGNQYGIFAVDTNSTTFTNNSFTDNVDYALGLTGWSAGDRVFDNDFINNHQAPPDKQAFDDALANRWNGTGRGNHWSDFDTAPEGCVDSPPDGFCDSPYQISPGNPATYDNYPRTNQTPGVPEPAYVLLSPLLVGVLLVLAGFEIRTGAPIRTMGRWADARRKSN